MKTPGGGQGGLRRALDRTALLDWQGGEYELVVVLIMLGPGLEMKITIRLVFVMTNLGFSVLTLSIEKVPPPIAAVTDYILFYVLISGPAKNGCICSLVTVSNFGWGEFCVYVESSVYTCETCCCHTRFGSSCSFVQPTFY